MHMNRTDKSFVVLYVDEQPRPETRGGTFGKQAQELERQGIVERRDGFWSLTEAGRKYRDGIDSELKAMFRSTRSVEER
jgi:hypothetical protein